MTIEYEFYDYEGYYTKLGTLAASNDIWDIFQLNNQFPQYINQIEPLDEYVEKGIIDVLMRMNPIWQRRFTTGN